MALTDLTEIPNFPQIGVVATQGELHGGVTAKEQ